MGNLSSKWESGKQKGDMYVVVRPVGKLDPTKTLWETSDKGRQRWFLPRGKGELLCPALLCEAYMVDPSIAETLPTAQKIYLPYDDRRIQPIKPSDHYEEYMRLYGLLDLNLNDPDLAPLFKEV